MGQILVVCTANICRSPMAEVLLADRLRRADPGSGWSVSSAGVWALEGLPASTGAQAVLEPRGMNLSAHRSRAVTPELLDQAHLVLVMTSPHRLALLADFPQAAGKVFLLAEMAGEIFDIVDPYGGPLEGYEQTAAELENLIDRGLKRIQSLAG